MSRIESGNEPGNPDNSLPNVRLFAITMVDDKYRDSIQFFIVGYPTAKFTMSRKKQLVV